MDGSAIGEIERFAPKILLQFLAAAPLADLPAVRRTAGALLWIDIVGWTALTNHFAVRGPEGIDTLRKFLNGYFRALTDTVHDHGGDIVAFAGDGMLCFWPGADDGLSDATLCAAACSVALRDAIGTIEIPEVHGHGGVRASMYLSAGRLDFVALAGTRGRHHFLLDGEALSFIQGASGIAEPGEILIASSAFTLVGDASEAAVLSPAWKRLKKVVRPVRSVTPETSFASTPQVSIARTFMSPTVEALLSVGLDEWTAEFRRVTVVSVRISDDHRSDPRKLQDTCIRIEQAVDVYGGVIQAFQADDKGTTVMIVLGLPFSSHEDDSWRGINAAIAISRALADTASSGMQAGIGVATGLVFCGFLGGRNRSNYGLIGDAVNLAFRLMQAAQGRLLCDATSVKEASSRMAFVEAEPATVKGFAKPVAVFVPLDGADQQARQARWKTTLFGRAREQERLSAILDRVREAGVTTVSWIEGDAGIGKSRLLTFAVERARADGFLVAGVSGDEIRRSVPYLPWMSVFRDLFRAYGELTDEQLRSTVLSLLEGNPLLLSWTPLLEPLLPIGFQENETTAQISGLARAEATAEIVVHLLRRFCQIRRILLAFDDAHWIDSASLNLLSAVARQVPNLLIVVATRYVNSPLRPFQELKDRQNTELFALGPLQPADMKDIAAARLGVREVPKELERLIFEKATGNPFFCEEIVFALRDGGAIRVEGDRCNLVTGASENLLVTLPSTVQGIIVSRFDLLDASEKRALKVASIIGRTFDLELLTDIYAGSAASSTARDEIRSHLNNLARLDLTLPPEEQGEDSRTFKHGITQEVIYSLMMPEQRNDLHRAIAEWYEARHGDDLTPFLSLLAFHWHRCGALSKAINYLVRAGRNAFVQNAAAEAVRFLSDALRFDSQLGQSTRAERGLWEAYLAEAYLKLSDFSSCRAHLGTSLRFLDHSVPSSSAGLLLRLPWDLSRYGYRRARKLLGVPVREKSVHEGGLLAHLHQLRAEVAFFDHDLPSLLDATLLCQTEAESLQPCAQLARSCGTTGIVAGVAGLRRIARSHCERGLGIAKEVGDLPTLAYVNQLASVHYNGIGTWDRADETICDAIEIYRRLGDRYRWQSCLMIRAYLRLYRGDFAGVDELVATTRPSAFPDGIAQVRAWSVAVELLSGLPRGRLEESLIGEGERAMLDGIDTSEEILVHGAVALAQMHRENFAEARRHAETATDLISKLPPPTYYTMGGVAGVVEVFLSLWERGQPPAGTNRRDLEAHAATAHKHMSRFAGRFPFARARSLLLEGKLAQLKNQPRRATRLWRKCLEEAKNHSMRFDAALACLLLSRHGHCDDKNQYEDEGHRLMAQTGAKTSLLIQRPNS